MKVEILVFEGVDELDAIGPLEVLRRAPGIEARLVTAEAGGELVRGANGLAFAPDGVLDTTAEVIVVSGGGWNTRAEAGAFAEARRGVLPRLLSDAAARGTVLASVCTGALLLAEARLLEGRRATTHHGARADLAAAGAVVLEDRVVDDGDIVTSGGVTSGIDLALWLVERFVDRNAADRIAEQLEYRRESPRAG